MKKIKLEKLVIVDEQDNVLKETHVINTQENILEFLPGGEFYIFDKNLYALAIDDTTIPLPVPPPVVIPPPVVEEPPPVIIIPPPPPPLEFDEIIKDGVKVATWANDYSWSVTKTLVDGSLALNPEAWGGYNLYSTKFNTNDYQGVRVELKATVGTDKVYLVFSNNQVNIKSVLLNTILGGTIPQDSYAVADVMFDDIGFDLPFTNLLLQNIQGADLNVFNVKNLSLIKRSVPKPTTVRPLSTKTPAVPTGWLKVAGNKILVNDVPWQGKGANVMDTRSCSVCMWNQPDPNEVVRRIKYAVSLGANLIRLCMESFANAYDSTQIQWKSALYDPAYLKDIKSIVDQVNTLYGGSVKVLLSLWHDPSMGANNVPTQKTAETWEVIAKEFIATPNVMFGLCNEPESNYNGANNAEVLKAMQSCINSIRYVEDLANAPHHVISVQGHGGWARHLSYYMTNPAIGDNIVYEIHIYDPAANFQSLLFNYTDKLPVVVGEFGPVAITGVANMTLADCTSLGTQLNSKGISWTVWTLHHKCPPNLLVDTAGGACGKDMPLQLTEWGNVFKALLTS